MTGNSAVCELTKSAERRAKLMGTDAHIIVVGDDAARLADHALARLQRLEARWSRFLPESEISQLNERPGVPVVVAPETYQLIDHALRAWRMTAGKFDPTILADLRAEGYDRTYELLDHPDASAWELERRANPQRESEVPRSPDIHLDHVVGSVTLGPSTNFDPGGIGKGFAADLVVEDLMSSDARGVLVSVGGDLRVAGEAPADSSWVVAIADPLDPRNVLGNLCLGSGAVASSWRTKRTWTGADGLPRHHLIDPRTGRSALTGIAGVTVVAAQGWHAEVLAKAAFLAGPDDGPALIAETGAAGLVVADDGTVHPAGDIAAFLLPASSGTGI